MLFFVSHRYDLLTGKIERFTHSNCSKSPPKGEQQKEDYMIIFETTIAVDFENEDYKGFVRVIGTGYDETKISEGQ